MKEIATAIFPALTAALLYFTGFIYLSAYYDYFGIVTSELDINAQDVFVNSYVALSIWVQHFGWIAAGVALGAALFIWALWPLTPAGWRKFVIDQKLAMGTLAALALFAAAYPIASYSGRTRADAALYNLPLLQVSMTGQAKETYPCQAQADCASPDTLLFVAATSSTIFAVSPRGHKKEFWTYRIPVAQMAYSRAFKYTTNANPEKSNVQSASGGSSAVAGKP